MPPMLTSNPSGDGELREAGRLSARRAADGRAESLTDRDAHESVRDEASKCWVSAKMKRESARVQQTRRVRAAAQPCRIPRPFPDWAGLGFKSGSSKSGRKVRRAESRAAMLLKGGAGGREALLASRNLE